MVNNSFKKVEELRRTMAFLLSLFCKILKHLDRMSGMPVKLTQQISCEDQTQEEEVNQKHRVKLRSIHRHQFSDLADQSSMR